VISSTATVNTNALSGAGKPIAGNYTQTSGALSGADAGNYTFASVTSASNYTINPMVLVGSIGAGSSTYGSDLSPGAVSFSNVLSGDKVQSSGVIVNTSSLSGAGKPIVGSYTQTASTITGADAANYLAATLTSAANYVINPLALVGSINSSSSIYASNLNPGSVSFSNALAGDTVNSLVTVNTSTLSSGGKPIVGSYTQTSGALSGADAGNYTFASVTSTSNYTINPLALIGVIETSSSTYGSNLSPGAISFSNALAGDLIISSAIVNTSTLSGAGKPIVGSYTQTSGSLNGVDAANYTFASLTSAPNYTINPRPMAGSIAASSSTYGSNLNPGAVSLSNVLPGDDVQSSGVIVNTKTLSGAGKPIVDSYTQTASSITGADSANYVATTLTSEPNYTINPLSLVASITAGSSTYGSKLNPGAVTFSNALSGDIINSVVSVNTSKLSGAGKPIVGQYTQTSGQLTGVDAGNYTFAGVTSSPNYTINPLALVGSVTSSNSVAGSSLVPGNVSFNNAIPGDSLGAATVIVNIPGAPSNSKIGNSVGSFPLSQSIASLAGADASNYSYSEVKGDYTIRTGFSSGSVYPSAMNTSSSLSTVKANDTPSTTTTLAPRLAQTNSVGSASKGGTSIANSTDNSNSTSTNLSNNSSASATTSVKNIDTSPPANKGIPTAEQKLSVASIQNKSTTGNSNGLNLINSANADEVYSNKSLVGSSLDLSKTGAIVKTNEIETKTLGSIETSAAAQAVVGALKGFVSTVENVVITPENLSIVGDVAAVLGGSVQVISLAAAVPIPLLSLPMTLPILPIPLQLPLPLPIPSPLPTPIPTPSAVSNVIQFSNRFGRAA
jgi:hypothetical protein